jgi:RimJ/RimL family protein N-acetyltransferase
MTNAYKVRPLTEPDIDLVISYFHDLSVQDANRMGLKKENLPSPADWRAAMLKGIKTPPAEPRGFLLIWELDGVAVGMNTIKDMTPGDTGYMHLHRWAQGLRGQGHGRRFFCLAAHEFFARFNLRHIYCEPRSTNPAPNRMLQQIGFPLIKTYTGQSSAIADVCELNRYEVLPDICRSSLTRR